MNRDRIVLLPAGLTALLALVGAACGDAGAGPPDGAAPVATVDGGGVPLPPDAAADGAAATGGPPDGFMALAPCLEPDRYVAAPTAVATSGFSYAPACLRVARGTSVAIEASAVHPLEPGPNGSPDSPIPHQSGPATVTFTRAGFFPYFCPEHTDVNMRGVVWVTDSM